MLGAGTPRSDLQTIDNATILEFLSSLLGGFGQLQWTDQKTSDSFRSVIAGIQWQSSRRNLPMLLQLVEQDPGVIAFAATRLSTQGLIGNLFHYSMKHVLADLTQSCRILSQVFVDKAKLKLNHETQIWQHAQLVGHISVGEKLVLCAEGARDFVNFLGQLRPKLDQWIPQQIEPRSDADDDADEVLRQRLAFHTSREASPYFITEENPHLQQLAAQTLLFANTLLQHLSQLGSQFGRGYLMEILADTSHIKSIAQMLQLTQFEPNHQQAGHSLDQPYFDSQYLDLQSGGGERILLHELTRQRIMYFLHDLRFACETLASSVLQGVGVQATEINSQHENSTAIQNTTKQIKRVASMWVKHLQSELMLKGVSEADSFRAASKITHYLESQNLNFSEVLASEIQRLDPVLQTYFPDLKVKLSQPQAPRLPLKKRLLTRIEAVLSSLGSGTLALMLIGVLGTSMSWSCGIKKPPVSVLETIRPSIPFKARIIAEPSPENGSGQATPELNDKPTIEGEQQDLAPKDPNSGS